MAITILTKPETHSPVYNPMNFLLSSTNTAQSNFKYICDIYIDGAATFTRLTKSADPDFGRGHFDVHNILQEYVTGKYISKSDDGFEKCDEGNVYYVCHFGEQYGPSSGVTNYASLTVDSKRYGWQGYVEPLPFISYAQNKFVATNNSSFRFLTDVPNNVRVRSDEDRWLHMISAKSTGITSMDIRTYATDGSLIQTVTVTNNFSTIAASGNEDRHLLRFPAGDNMNDIASADVTAGSLPVITASVAKYTIDVNSSLSLASSGTTTFVIDDRCSKFDKYTLHWRNQLGGYDTQSFILQSKKKVTAKRDSYKKVIGTLASSSFTYLSTDRANTVYNVLLDDEITIMSDWLRDVDQQWLEQLITSPEVYHDDDTYGLVAINVKDTMFEHRKRDNEKLINMTVIFDYAVNRYRK